MIVVYTCAMRKATSVHQLTADLPACRLTPTNKLFKFCAANYLGPHICYQNRSNCKAWGLLFIYLCTRYIDVEIVADPDLNNFLLAFSLFPKLYGAVNTKYTDNGPTFCAAAKQLSSLLGSTEFHNLLGKCNINWVRTPPICP